MLSFLSDLLRWFGQGLLTTAVNNFGTARNRWKNRDFFGSDGYTTNSFGNSMPGQLPEKGHGSNAGHSSGVAGVDARRATPPDPRLARWGLASCCQLDPSHPALVTRQDPGVEPCLIPAGQACL